MTTAVKSIPELLAALSENPVEQALLRQCSRYETGFVARSEYEGLPDREYMLEEHGQPATGYHLVEYSQGDVGALALDGCVTSCSDVCTCDGCQVGKSVSDSEVDALFVAALEREAPRIVKVWGVTAGGRRLEGSRIYSEKWQFVIHRREATLPVLTADDLPWGHE